MVIVVILLLVFGCGEQLQIREWAFASMEDCMKGIRSDSGASVKQLALDTPKEVAGFLFNGDSFICLQITMDERTVYIGQYASRRSRGIPVVRHPF